MNTVILTGNLGSDPELRYTPNGIPVASFSLAVNRTWKDGSGDRQQKTTWVRVTCWRKLAEVVSEHLTKGAKVAISGELESASAFIKDNEARGMNEVTALAVEFLDGKSETTTPQPAANQQPQNEDIPF